MNGPTPSAAHLAAQLLDTAVECEQAVLRCDDTTPVDEIRALVREMARHRRVRIRTGVVDDVLAVVRADAAIWQQSASTMRAKLAAPKDANVVE